MTTFYGVSAPLASGKTTAAIEFAGRAAQAGEKFVIAQPSINLINQSIRQFQQRWPNVGVRAIHSETTNNVVHAISDHTKASTSGEVPFVTHAALMQSMYWHHRKESHLIIDEAPQVFYHAEFTLPVNHDDLLPALEIEPHNVRYSRSPTESCWYSDCLIRWFSMVSGRRPLCRPTWNARQLISTSFSAGIHSSHIEQSLTGCGSPVTPMAIC